jgi:serine/threonine protein kinase
MADSILPAIPVGDAAVDVGALEIQTPPGRCLRSNSLSVVRLWETADGRRWAHKTLRRSAEASAIGHLAELSHPCVLQIRGHVHLAPGAGIVVVTELMANGAVDGSSRGFLSPTKVSKIVAGAAFGMRFMHAHGAVHGHLTPDNLLLDEKWRVHIADFGTSGFGAAAGQSAPCYLAPERFEESSRSQESDVYSFGLILFELIVGERVFSRELHPWAAMAAVIDGKRPEIPENVESGVAELIESCWSQAPGERPPFGEICERLKGMHFEILAGVKREKVAAFVSRIEEWEEKLREACSSRT